MPNTQPNPDLVVGPSQREQWNTAAMRRKSFHRLHAVSIWDESAQPRSADAGAKHRADWTWWPGRPVSDDDNGTVVVFFRVLENEDASDPESPAETITMTQDITELV